MSVQSNKGKSKKNVFIGGLNEAMFKKKVYVSKGRPSNLVTTKNKRETVIESVKMLQQQAS